MAAREQAGCTYEVDADLRIASVGGEWTEFALANDAPHLVPPGPIGRPLLSFIADPTTSHVYAQLMDRVRSTGRSVTVPFRCDSAGARRYMSITIEKAGDDHMVFHTELERVVYREPIPLLDPAARRSENPILMCGWCKSLPIGEDWVELETALRITRLFERDFPLPPLSHVICPDCESTIQRSLRQ